MSVSTERKIVRDFRPLPDGEEGLFELLASLFEKYRGRLVELIIRSGEPLAFGYIGELEAGERENLSPPYEILRMAKDAINEFEPPEGEPSRSILFMMMQHVVATGCQPVCVIVGSSEEFWDWLQVPSREVRKRGDVIGYPVHPEVSLSDRTVIVAGASNPALGAGGLTFGLRYAW